MSPNIAIPQGVVSAAKTCLQLVRQLQAIPLCENAFYDDYSRESVDNMNSMSREIYDIHKEVIDKKLDSLAQDMREVKKDVSDIKVYISKLDTLISSYQDEMKRMNAEIARFDGRLWLIMSTVVASILVPIALKFLFP
jgi:peptidoglycan hydrolase CwlO-like protein